jgi:hypothetical protein
MSKWIIFYKFRQLKNSCRMIPGLGIITSFVEGEGWCLGTWAVPDWMSKSQALIIYFLYLPGDLMAEGT